MAQAQASAENDTLHEWTKALATSSMPMAIFGPDGQGARTSARRVLAPDVSKSSLLDNVHHRSQFSHDSSIRGAHQRISAFQKALGTQDSLEGGAGSLSKRMHCVLDDLDNNYYIYRKPSKLFNIIGIVAGVVSLAAIIPQIVQIIERESACDLSLTFLLGSFGVQVLWVAYSFGNKLYLNGMFALVTALVLLFMLFLKKHYDSDALCARAPLTQHQQS